MTFSISAIMRALLAPNYRLSCNRALWHRIVTELEKRGERRHEAGCFLLGSISKSGKRRVTNFIFYDQLDHDAYSTGICILHAEAFAKLWTICREQSWSVVGDIHTHPGAGFQSESDRTNPMVGREGHIAIILPDFARWPINHQRMGIYEYKGDHDWINQSPDRNPAFFYSGFWS